MASKRGSRPTVAPIGNLTMFENVHTELAPRHREKMIALFGDPGVGKTEAARYLQDQGIAHYFECPVNPTYSGFASALARSLGVAPKRSGQETVEEIIAYLQQRRVTQKVGRREITHHPTLIFDEAQRLMANRSLCLMELARYLHDRGDLSVVLVGMPDLKNTLLPYRQLYDRIHFVEFRPWSAGDVRVVADMCHGVALDEPFIKALLRETHGVGRRIARALESVAQFAQLSGSQTVALSQWVDPAGAQLPIVPVVGG